MVSHPFDRKKSKGWGTEYRGARSFQFRWDWVIMTGMEPNLKTDCALANVLAELVSREAILHRPESGSTRADLERMMVEDFWETGASGRRYSREFVLDELERRTANPPADEWHYSDFHCRRLGPDTYLLTYTLVQDQGRCTRRMTIWQQASEGWKAVYHQGTEIEAGTMGPREQASRPDRQMIG